MSKGVSRVEVSIPIREDDCKNEFSKAYLDDAKSVSVK